MKIDNTYDVFISYSSNNKNNAKKLASYLDDNGIKVWLDYWELSFGENIFEVIDNAIKNSKIIFTLIDLSYLNSPWTKKELESSLGEDKKNIFFIEKNIDTYNLPRTLVDYQHIKIDYNNLDNLFEKLQDIDNLFKVKYLLKNAKKLYENMDYQSSLIDYKNLLTISNKINIEKIINLSVIYSNIASNYQALSNYSEALKYYIKALDINENSSDEYAIATNYNQLASLFMLMDDTEKALEYVHISAYKYKKIFGDNHIALVKNYNNLGILYQSIKVFDIALNYMNKALKIQLELLGENHLDIGKTYNSLALLFYEKKDNEKAIEYMNKSIKILNKYLDNNHVYLINSKKILNKIIKEKTNEMKIIWLKDEPTVSIRTFRSRENNNLEFFLSSENSSYHISTFKKYLENDLTKTLKLSDSYRAYLHSKDDLIDNKTLIDFLKSIMKTMTKKDLLSLKNKL